MVSTSLILPRNFAEFGYPKVYHATCFRISLIPVYSPLKSSIICPCLKIMSMTSVNSGTPSFNKHLQSADIFNVEKFPEAKFVSDKFVFDGDKLKEVTGQLTMMGKTAPMTIKAHKFTCYESPMLQKREVCGGDFEATIDRTQWGVNYGIPYGFPKEVRLVMSIEAVKQ